MTDEIKTKEWLKSHFETGDTPTGEDYGNMLDSYWHKSELGQVVAGDEHLVTGHTVAEAIGAALDGLDIVSAVRDAVADLLPPLVADFVNGDTLAEAIAGLVTKEWVGEHLEEKATSTDVAAALAEKIGAAELAAAMAQKADIDVMNERLSAKADASSVAVSLAGKADATDVYTRAQIDSVVAARPTQTEMAGELSATIANLPNNAAFAELRAKIDTVTERVNTLTHVACGSETMNVCLSDIPLLQQQEQEIDTP